MCQQVTFVIWLTVFFFLSQQVVMMTSYKTVKQESAKSSTQKSVVKASFPHFLLTFSFPQWCDRPSTVGVKLNTHSARLCSKRQHVYQALSGG